jgi:hypothetical protein
MKYFCPLLEHVVNATDGNTVGWAIFLIKNETSISQPVTRGIVPCKN